MITKRLIISTVMGLIFGLVCYSFASSGPNTLPASLAFSVILSITLIGFAIGISNLKFSHWAFHGIIMGLIFSMPMGFSAMSCSSEVTYTPGMMLISTIVLGMISGFLIELVTTVLLQAKQVTALKKSIL